MFCVTGHDGCGQELAATVWPGLGPGAAAAAPRRENSIEDVDMDIEDTEPAAEQGATD